MMRLTLHLTVDVLRYFHDFYIFIMHFSGVCFLVSSALLSAAYFHKSEILEEKGCFDCGFSSIFSLFLMCSGSDLMRQVS